MKPDRFGLGYFYLTVLHKTTTTVSGARTQPRPPASSAPMAGAQTPQAGTPCSYATPTPTSAPPLPYDYHQAAHSPSADTTHASSSSKLSQPNKTSHSKTCTTTRK